MSNRESRGSNGRGRRDNRPDPVFTEDAWRRGWGDYEDYKERKESARYRGNSWENYQKDKGTRRAPKPPKPEVEDHEVMMLKYREDIKLFMAGRIDKPPKNRRGS